MKTLKLVQFMEKIFIFAVAIFLASCGGGADVVYDVPFEQMMTGVQETGKDFCMVISRTDCPPCAEYARALTDGRGGFAYVAYNIIG